MRNQNIYTAQITGGLVVGAPGIVYIGAFAFGLRAGEALRGISMRQEWL
jgi:hypothetical protein